MKLNSSTATTAGITLLAGLALFSVYSAASPRYSDWSVPVNLGPVVNSQFFDGSPHISKNGLSLYFASDRLGGLGGRDLWVSHRASHDQPWGPPVSLGPRINTATNEFVPALSRDEHLLFFATDRPGGFGGLDIWVSWRAHTRDDFAWQPPVNLGPNINTVGLDVAPSYFENDDVGIPLLYFVSNRPGGVGANDIYVSELMTDGSFGPAMLVRELSSPAFDISPSVRFDGLEIFIGSDRGGTIGALDLWVSTRETVGDPWSEPVNLGPVVNTGSGEFFPSISSDRETLFFASPRPGGIGGLDIWMSTRTKVRGPQ